MKLLLFLLAIPVLGQSPVFVQFSPTVIRMTIGSSMCTFWSQLPPPWPVIAYCVGGGAHPLMEPGSDMHGGFRSADGEFDWLIYHSKSAPAPALDWQIVGTPTGGSETMKSGTF